MKPNNYRKNSFFRNIKSSEVKHSSNLQKKSNEMSLVVVSECDFRQKFLIRDLIEITKEGVSPVDN